MSKKTLKERVDFLKVRNEVAAEINADPQETMDGGEWNDGSFPQEIGAEIDDSEWEDVPDEQPEETAADRNNRMLHEMLIAAAASSLPRSNRRTQASFTKKRAKKLDSKERRKRAKQSRNGKRK